MTSYTTGLVSVTNGSTGVTGSSTAWTNAVVVGDLFALSLAGPFYEVVAIGSDTSITLDRAYAGSTQSNQSYVILRLSLSRQSTAFLANRVQELLDNYNEAVSLGDNEVVTLNKSATANNAMVQIRTDGSERWRYGAIANDDFRLQRSADGSTFSDALTVNRTTGALTIHAGGLTVAGTTDITGDIRAFGTEIRVDHDDGHAILRARAYRQGSVYNSSCLLFDAPRNNTGDGGYQSGRAMITARGNDASTTSEIWLHANSASLYPNSDLSVNQGFQHGMVLDNNGQVSFWRSGVEHARIRNAGDCFVTGKFRSSGDNIHDLGGSSNRWKTLYAGTGTINTSDAREKEWRSGLTAEELRVAARIAPQIGVFRWLDAIAEKGEAARLHIGLTSQMVQAAFKAEGLDPAHYAMWCEDEIWDQEEYAEPVAFLVPKLDAKGQPLLNKDGQEILETEVREVDRVRSVQRLKDDGTPETRLGLRMDQVMMFLLAAGLLRLDNSEQRLVTLEAA